MNVNLLLLVAVMSVFAPFAAQKREASKEVRSKLFNQVLAEYPDVRECIVKEEGGARAAEENATVEEVDLNRDGIPEYEVSLSGPCVCGMVNCSIYLYRRRGAGYELILEDASGLGIELLKTSSNGFADLRIDARTLPPPFRVQPINTTAINIARRVRG